MRSALPCGLRPRAISDVVMDPVLGALDIRAERVN